MDEVDQDVENLVAVMSTRGHYIDQEFVPKEFSIKCFGDHKPITVHCYNQDKPHNQLTEHDKVLMNRYIHNNFFDIPYKKFWMGMIYPSSIRNVIDACNKHNYPEVRDDDNIYDPIDITMGYYGSQYEKAILDLLGIRSVNLTDYGCPTTKQLIEDYERHNVQLNYKGCGMHTDEHSINCCKSDVLLYEHWVLHRIHTPHKSELHKSYQSKLLFNFLNLQRDFVKMYEQP